MTTPSRARLVFFALVFSSGLLSLPRLPSPRPADAPADTFSATRAIAPLATWAAAPRVSGTPRHHAVVDDLDTRLAALGFTVRRETTDTLENLVASAPGASEAGGVWITAHTDSVPGAPGAADDGLGMAVAVEAARALAVEGPPADLHVLLTDGEEIDLLGAAEHARHATTDRRVMLNVEARGTEGPVYMFQTNGPTDALLDAWQRSGCAAQTTSLARTVYTMLPSDTDFSVFRRKGWWGYDFALIHGAGRYHTPADTPANLDPRSVQQAGDCVVGLAREWLTRPLDGASRDLALPYTQIAGHTVVMPPWLVRLLALAPVLLLPRPRGVAGLLGAGAYVGAGVAAFFVGVGALYATVTLSPTFLDNPAEVGQPAPWYALAAAIGAGSAVAAFAAARRLADASTWGWHAAGVGIAAAVGLAAPEVGYVLVPGAWVSALALRRMERAAVVPGVLAAALLAPFLYAAFPALTTRMLPILCVLPVLLLGWALPGARPPAG